MTDWYCHDPAQGRVGPLTEAELLARYRQRRIQLDTLVWHAGMREWEPLERQAETLQLHTVQPDTSLPPPLPPSSGPRPMVADVRTHRAPPPKQGMSGCMIALIIVGALAVPTLGILAAIAIPAYQDYTVRAKVSQAMAESAPARDALARHMRMSGSCPANGVGFAAPESYATPGIARIIARPRNGNCTLELELRNLTANTNGGTLLWTAAFQGGEIAWDCSGGTLPARYLPAICRTSQFTIR